MISIVIVTGPPATGKSTLAQRLIRRFDLIPLEKDLIKETLHDALVGVAAEDLRVTSAMLSDASFALMFALARRLSRPGVRLMLEGNFRPGEHEPALRALGATEAPVRFAQVLCRCDETLRRARLGARTASAQRHPVHDDAWGRVPAGARSTAGMLDLPGDRLIYDSGSADASHRFEELCSRLARWFD